MEVRALALPKLDTRTIDTLTGEGVYRDLDRDCIKPESPKASLRFLSYSHLHYVFGLLASEDELDQLDFGSLSWAVVAVSRRDRTAIFSGTLDVLASFVSSGMSRTASHDQRMLCNAIYTVFRAAGITEPWEDHTISQLADGTHIFK